MRRTPIDAVSNDPVLGLLVKPVGGQFEYIYRDASGIRWNRERESFVAYEPERWDSFELFCQILYAVRNEYGVTLYLSPDTIYESVSDELRSNMIDFSITFSLMIENP